MGETKSLRQVMTSDPIVLDATASVGDAARAMRSRDVGDVLVRKDGELCGIVTDRDLVVRVLAEDSAATNLQLGEICSREIATLSPDDSVDDAVRLMEQNAIRRVPIVEAGKPVGIVSLGDLAVLRDRNSALGEISAAPPSR